MAHGNVRPPTDLRRARAQRERTALGLVIFTLLVVGSGLIWWILGPSALVGALPCFLGGAALIVVVWLLLTGLEWWRRRQDEKVWKELEEDKDG